MITLNYKACGLDVLAWNLELFSESLETQKQKNTYLSSYFP